MAITSFSSPTPEDTEELLLITRYGELDELKSFIEKFGTKPLVDARDEDGNTVLHMVCGNGHLGATARPGFHLRFSPSIPVFIYGLDFV